MRLRCGLVLTRLATCTIREIHAAIKLKFIYRPAADASDSAMLVSLRSGYVRYHDNARP